MLSVIVPVYNVEKYLVESLDSLHKQQSKDVEFLIVNDGSTDNSQTIIDEYVKKDNRFISYTKENGGLSDARNYALQYAKGDYVLFFDSDDILDENAVSIINDIIKDKPDCIVFDFEFFWENQDKRRIIKGINNEQKDLIKSILVSTPSACNKVFKKELFTDVKFPFGLYYEDLATIPVLISKCQRIKYVEKALYHYRQRQGSIIYTYSNKARDVFTCLKNDFNYYKNNGIFNDYYEELEYLCIEHLLLNGNRRFYHGSNPQSFFKESKDFTDSFFSNCLNNRYYKKMSFNDRTFIRLAYNGSVGLLKILMKIKGLLK